MQFKVIWFDRLRGDGMAKGLNGEGTGVIYACNIPGKKTWYPETACVYYDDGQIFDAEIRDGFIIPLTPGKFDQVKWDSLDHDRLAFRCDENGKAITGLFSRARRKA